MVFSFNKSLIFKLLGAILLVLILMLPTYWRMLKPGIYSMHDPHLFRQFEFDKCVRDLQLPCRWAPDSGFEYGEPMFNFYTQMPYAFAEIFRLVGFQVIDSIKIVFALSLILSFISMFFLSKQIWGNSWSAVLSGLVYVYAPYRAVDVFVRGALPEALAYVFFPLIVYFFNDYLKSKRYKSLGLFILFLTLLILVHNLSVFMFGFFFIFWVLYSLIKTKTLKLIPSLILSGLIVLGLASFYLLPVVFESKYIDLTSTIQGYYNFENHFVTLKQLLISRFWGYGASVWGDNDGLSLSVGHVQWILPILILGFIVIKKQTRKYMDFLVLFILGWFMLYLTHNKSERVWSLIPQMAYVQFPWRFLGLAVFSFAAASGALINLLGNINLKIISSKLLILLLVGAILIILNTSFFFEDLWFNLNDSQYFSGLRYTQQLIPSSLGDFWPTFGGKLPDEEAPNHPLVESGQGSGSTVLKLSNLEEYSLNIKSKNAKVIAPLVFFPGWTGYLDNQPLNIYPSTDLGLATANVTSGNHILLLKFENTLIRTIGNTISIIFFGVFMSLFFILKKKKHEI